VAASDRIRADLGWTPRHTDLAGIVRDAWDVARNRS
jgi:UDP-glucose 4-epimerase